MTRRATCGDRGGVSKSGAPCGATLGLSETTGLCAAHDPERATSYRQMQARGGRTSTLLKRVLRAEQESVLPETLPTFEPDSLEHLSQWLQWTARAAATGELHHRTAAEITRALRELRPVLINLDLERRLKEAERLLARAQKELEKRHARGD